MHDGHSVVVCERLRQCSDRRIIRTAGWGEHAAPQPSREHLRSHEIQRWRSQRIQQLTLVVGEARQRQEDVAVAEHQIGHLEVELTARGPARETQRHAVAPIVGDDRTGAGPQDLRQVVPEEFTVASQCVVLTRGLVGEAEPGQIQDGHPVVGAQLADHVAPVDTAGRKAMHQNQKRCLGVAEFSVKDIQTVGVLKRFAGDPGEVTAGLTPAPGTLCHGLSPVFRRGDRTRVSPSPRVNPLPCSAS